MYYGFNKKKSKILKITKSFFVYKSLIYKRKHQFVKDTTQKALTVVVKLSVEEVAKPHDLLVPVS